jgi:hypothetical protein
MKELITPITAVITSVVAISALAYQISLKRIEDDNKEIDEWQKTVVYDVLGDSEEPLSFDQVYAKYLTEVKNESYRRFIPDKQKTKEELQRVVISLLEVNIVGYDSEKRYYIRGNPDDLISNYFSQYSIANEQKGIESALTKKLMNKSGRSLNDLYIEIKDETDTYLTFNQFHEVVRELWRSGIVNMTEDGLVHINFAKYNNGDSKPSESKETSSRLSDSIGEIFYASLQA